MLAVLPFLVPKNPNLLDKSPRVNIMCGDPSQAVCRALKAARLSCCGKPVYSAAMILFSPKTFKADIRIIYHYGILL